MMKLITEDAEPAHRLMAYTILGQLGQRIPTLVNKDLSLLQKFFDVLTCMVCTFYSNFYFLIIF